MCTGVVPAMLHPHLQLPFYMCTVHTQERTTHFLLIEHVSSCHVHTPKDNTHSQHKLWAVQSKNNATQRHKSPYFIIMVYFTYFWCLMSSLYPRHCGNLCTYRSALSHVVPTHHDITRLFSNV